MVKILQGKTSALRFAVTGKGRLILAKSEQAIEWGLRNDKGGQRYFVLWFDPEKPAKGEVKFTAHFRNTYAQAKGELGAINLIPQGEAMLNAGQLPALCPQCRAEDSASPGGRVLRPAALGPAPRTRPKFRYQLFPGPTVQ